MKRTLFTILLSTIVVSAGAQTMYDALTFSQNDYYGTARSIGMGNAMTAVGGDLGSIGLNPAGSAVAGYSQFTISPSLTLTTSSTSFSAYPVNGVDKYTNEQNSRFTKMTLPNIGMTFNLSTGNERGLKSVTYGVVINTTNDYTGKMMGGGANDRTSYLGAMAVGTDGCDIDIMNGYLDNNGNAIDQWDYAYYNTYYPFNSIVNAQIGSISNFGDVDDENYYTRYIAATEGYSKIGPGQYDIYLQGPLNQRYGRQTTGSKSDYLFNAGLNFSDNFYVGANLGAVTLSYNYDEYFKEAAQNNEDFPIDLVDKDGNGYTIHFDNYRARYSYSASGSGVYAKVGFIAKPTTGLRIGAAIQTPTIMNINETWQHAADIHYADSRDDAEAVSPKGSYSYTLRSPYRTNAGLAYTFMGMGLVSVDYEMTDYRTMKFSTLDDYGYDSSFDNVNQDIRNHMGVSHQLRIGAEVKPAPEVAIRAGYNHSTTPEYYDNEVLHDKINSYSVGVGYSSNGAFFLDLAGRLTTLSDEYISPYVDYLDDCASPLLLNKRSRWILTATLGWRF